MKKDLNGIEFSEMFYNNISPEELDKIIGTEFDDSHYYYGKLINATKKINKNEKSSLSFKPNNSINSIIGRFSIGKDNYRIVFRGESKITSFGNFISFEGGGIININMFEDLKKLIKGNNCIEESIPYFAVEKIENEKWRILSHETIVTTLADVIDFKAKKEKEKV